MADTEYKITNLETLAPFAPTLGQIAPLKSARWAPFLQVLKAQDAAAAATRRVVASWNLSGSTSFSQPTGTPIGPGASQDYPDGETWRDVGEFTVRMVPGATLEAHFVYVRCGLTEIDIGGTWTPSGPGGQVRVRTSWEGLASAGPYDTTTILQAHNGEDGTLPTSQASAWQFIEEAVLPNIYPPFFLASASTARNFSEAVEMTIDLAVLGGVRPVALIVYELPRTHVHKHDDAGPHGVHTAGDVVAEQTPKPQEEAADGTTYEEHRFGSHRMLDTAARQAVVLVPRIAHWCSWDEGTQDYTDTGAAPISTSSASFVDLLDSAITTWGLENPGWIVAASHALPHRYNDAGLILRDENAVVPVRISVDAEWTTGGGSSGTVRFQTGPYEWIDVEFTSSGTRETLQAYGLLNSQVYPDHHGGLLQVFLKVDNGSDTLDVYAWSIDLLE